MECAEKSIEVATVHLHVLGSQWCVCDILPKLILPSGPPSWQSKSDIARRPLRSSFRHRMSFSTYRCFPSPSVLPNTPRKDRAPLSEALQLSTPRSLGLPWNTTSHGRKGECLLLPRSVTFHGNPSSVPRTSPNGESLPLHTDLQWPRIRGTGELEGGGDCI